MSTKQKGYQQYKKTSVQSASREKILLMLYEGAIKFVKRARIAMEKKEISQKCENIGKAYDIILELNNSLDHKVGGELSAQLEQLYMYMTDELNQANIQNKVEHLDNVLKILDTLYDGWKQAVEEIKKNNINLEFERKKILEEKEK